jgi:hypothetical protein
MPSTKGGVGSIIRFGSPFGGSSDGPEFLKDYAIDEGMYKVCVIICLFLNMDVTILLYPLEIAIAIGRIFGVAQCRSIMRDLTFGSSATHILFYV